MKLLLPLLSMSACLLTSATTESNHVRIAKSKKDKSPTSTPPLKSSKSPKSTPPLTPSKSTKSTKISKSGLPEINILMNTAFPMWEIDANGNRVVTKSCTVDSCEWNPFYVTKRYDGLHPDFGGHPTDLDVKYPFFGGSPFGGQPYSGTPHHCKQCDTDDIKAKECPKIVTVTDTGPDGPGHVPPHISLASLVRSVEGGIRLATIFDYDRYQCRVIPDVLLKMIRKEYPRVGMAAVDYPKPTTVEGGDFKYEFPSGNGLGNQTPPYADGPPHWCTAEMKATGHWDGVCPYVFEGPDAGKYRHPHIAYAALEVYLANKVMPSMCKKTWLQNNPQFLDSVIRSDTPFPTMDGDANGMKTVANWIGQPALPWTYDSGDPKTYPGPFSTETYFSQC